jgi:D-alanine-D-alanine ligase
VGEILPRDGFYSYQAKYLDPDGAELRIPARISEEQAARVRQLAVDTFRLFGCRGMARVDFFVTKDEVVVNELNAIPGFTTISMYPMLWKASGVGYAELVERLVGLALEGAAADRQLRTVL